jgi:hypothetical protein
MSSVSTLRIGDIISLSIAQPYSGWLSSEGILTDDCILASEDFKFENCLWEVTVQHQYNSTKEIIQKKTVVNFNNEEEEDRAICNERKQKDDFISASINEDRLNEKLMSMKFGKPVAFGDVIQLRHFLSRKYLTVSSTALAKVERRNMRVGMQTRGDSMSWLEFMPRYKYDREGQHITNDTETYIRIHEKTSEYIHAARKVSKFAINNSKEINCSLESSCWKINIFQKASDTKTKNILLGNLVSLQEPESSTYLTLDARRQSNTQNRANVVMSSSMQLSFSASDCNVGTNLLWMIEGEDMFHGGAVSNQGSNVALRDLNSGLYMKMGEDGVTAVRNRQECSFFELSTSQQSDIGSDIPDGTIIQLSCHNDFVAMKKGSNAKSKCEGSSDRSSALSMVITSKLQNNLGVDLMAGIEATIVLRRFETLIRTKQMFSMPKSNIEAEVRRFFACIDLISDFLQPEISDKSASLSSSEARLELADTVTIVIRQTMLREQGFLVVLLDIIELCALGTFHELSNGTGGGMNLLKRGSTEPILGIHKDEDEDDDKFSAEEKSDGVDKRADFFKKKSDVSFRQSLAVKSSPSPSASLDKEAQRNKMRLSFMAAAAQMKLKDTHGEGKVAAPNGGGFMSLVKAASLKKKLNNTNLSKRHTMMQESSSAKTPINVGTSNHINNESNGFKSTVSGEIAKVCLDVLFNSIQKNHVSQMSIADYFSVLLNQVKYHREAILCVQEILKDNLQMLQTKIRDREIKIFLDQLLGIEMNVTLLNLLRSSCSCPAGVDNTQRMVVNALFHREILFLKKSNVEKTVGLWRSNSFMQKLRPGTLLDKKGATGQDTAAGNRESLAKLKLKQAAKNVANLKNQSLSGGQVAGQADKSSRSVLISISEKRNVVRHVAWPDKKVYFPKSSREFEEDVLGNHILKYGIPDLVVDWFTEENSREDFSSLTLFGHKSETPFNEFFTVKLIHDADEDLALAEKPTKKKMGSGDVSSPVSFSNRPMSPTSSHPHLQSPPSTTSKASSKRFKRMNTSSKKTIAKRRSQVVQYFISQMYLVADLCLDRNYIAIALLEKFYTYGMLLTVLKTQNCPAALQAPVMRIVRCLYVDREPQVEAKFPRLVKTSVTLKGGNESTFEDYHVGSQFKFGVLQQIISDYLHNTLDITKCDDLSSEAIDLVLCLMKYGYYSNAGQLQDIIHPLVEALVSHRLGSGPDSVVLDDNSDEGGDDEQGDYSDEGFGMDQKPDAFSLKNVSKLVRASSLRYIGKLPAGAAKVTPQSENSNEFSAPASIDVQLVSVATKTLQFLESLKVLIFVLCLIVITTTFTVLGFFSEKNKLAYVAFDLFVSVFFVTELILRMSCYRIVKEEIASFFSSSLNILDVVIVVFDLVLLFLDPQFFQYAAKFAKALKVFRIVRLFRVFRAARLLKTIAEKSVVHDEWVLPERYSKTTDNEVRTIAGILRILRMAHDRIEDHKLSTIFTAYIEWKSGPSQQAEDAVTITARAIEEHQSQSALIPPKFDEALTDIIMHSNPVLVKEGLNLLRVLKSEDQLLTNCLKKVQIISTASSEKKYQKIIVNLRKMKKYAETFEIWGALYNDDHLSIANELLQMLSDLCDMVNSPTTNSLFDLYGEAVEDVEIQNLLSNLDAMKDMMSIQESLLDASIDNMDPIIKKIIISCNELMCSYVSGNEENQVEAFKHFDWFLKKVDDIPNSSKVVRAMIHGNRGLIKQVQYKHLAGFIQKITANGQRAEYLDLFVGLTDIEDTGDGSISLLRNEISRYVTNTERSSYMLLWCCARGSKAYEARVSAMEPYADLNHPPRDDELSQDLQYHINLLQLLVGCKLGPKIQAIYPLDDVVAAILDDRTIHHVKNKLGAILQGMIASNTEAIEASESMWLFFEYVVEFFQEAETDFAVWTKTSKKVSKLARAHYCEWMRICVSASDLFFSGFDMALFLDACDIEESSFNITHRSEQDVVEVITNLRATVNTFLSKHKKMMSQQCVATYEQLIAALSQLLQHDVELDTGDVRAEPDRFLRNRLAQVNRQASLAEDVQQVLTRRKFQDFVSFISTPPEELQEQSIHAFLKLPEISAPVVSDVRFEALLLKITNYIRTQITKTSNAFTLDESVYPSTVWVIKTLRIILEEKINTKITDLSDPLNLNNEVLSVSWYHSVMNTNGVTFLCLDLIAVGIETSLAVEAMKLLIMLVSKNGGNLEVQETIYRYLSETDSTLFFEQMKEIIELQIVWCGRFSVDNRKAHQQSDFADSKNTTFELCDEIFSLKFLSAMCDGHFPLKLILREQDGNSRFVNIVDQLAHFAETISRMEGHTCTKFAIRVIHTIYVLIQGPCVGIQEHFVLHTDMLTALNRLMRASRPSQNFTIEWGSDLESLKEFVIDVLRVSIEGQPSNSVVVERIKTTIDISLLSVLIIPVETDENGNSLELLDLTRMQAKYLVFLQALDDDHDTEMPFNAMERINKDIAFVEVMWKDHLTVHYFHIPEIAKDLSESSKSVIIAEMNCLSQDLKLKDFLKKSRALYREATHQMYLKSYGVSDVWHFIDTVSRIMFVNVIVMNIILIARYVEDSSGNIYLPPATRQLLLGLNIVHCIMSFNNVVVSLFVRLPVIYSTHISNGVNQVLSVFYALTDMLQLWYFVYLGVTILAILKSYLFLSLLLLDFIVLDATSRDVLYAVVIPARQLFSTFIIMLIVLYITAVVIFVFFRNEYLSFEDDNNSMWVSVVLAFNYGIRATEGLGQYMFDTTGIRLIVDTAIYFILVVILRNIFFGIIINTFGELRNIKKEREEHVSNRCFICGIDRHDYDKMRHKDQGDFKSHRNQSHNIWNYLYFVVKIWYQPRNQDTSLEQYVRLSMENDDTNWFPVGVIGNSCDVLGEVMRDDRSSDHHVDNSHSNSSMTPHGQQSSVSEEKSKEANSQLEVFSKINEKLTIMERQSHIGDSLLLRRPPSSNSTMNLKPAVVIRGNEDRKGSAQPCNEKSSTTTTFVEITVRKETISLQESLKLLRSSISNCSGKLDDIESASSKPQRLAGIRVPPKSETSLAAVRDDEFPTGSRAATRGALTPGPSLQFLTPPLKK